MGYNVTMKRRKQALHALEKAELDTLVEEHASNEAKAFYHMLRGTMNELVENWEEFTHELDGHSTYMPFYKAMGLEFDPYHDTLLVPSEIDIARARRAYEVFKDGDRMHMETVTKDLLDSLEQGYSVMITPD